MEARFIGFRPFGRLAFECSSALQTPLVVEDEEKVPEEKNFNPWLWLGWILAVVIAILLILLGINQLGDEETPKVSPTSSPSSSSSSPSTSPISSTPPPYSGTYTGTIKVSDDSNGHAPFIGTMPGELDVLMTRDSETGEIVLDIKGALPFIPVHSDGFDTATNSFTASGEGTVTERNIRVDAMLEGELGDGSLTGTLTFTGTPKGPISYALDMTRSGEPALPPA